MEYHVDWLAGASSLADVEGAILDADPAAIVDLDASGHVLRVSGSLATVELKSVLHDAGYAVTDRQITALPTYCCGDCGG
jgi:hypothetical protein